MNFSAPVTGDGPEAEEGLEIPGFPKPHKPEGFAGNLQVGKRCRRSCPHRQAVASLQHTVIYVVSAYAVALLVEAAQ